MILEYKVDDQHGAPRFMNSVQDQNPPRQLADFREAYSFHEPWHWHGQDVTKQSSIATRTPKEPAH